MNSQESLESETACAQRPCMQALTTARPTSPQVNSQESLESETGPGGEAGPYQILCLLPGWAHTSIDRELVRSPEDACTQHIGSAPPAKCRPNGPG